MSRKKEDLTRDFFKDYSENGIGLLEGLDEVTLSELLLFTLIRLVDGLEEIAVQIKELRREND